MISRTSQPAGGTLLIAAMKEIAAFDGLLFAAWTGVREGRITREAAPELLLDTGRRLMARDDALAGALTWEAVCHPRPIFSRTWFPAPPSRAAPSRRESILVSAIARRPAHWAQRSKCSVRCSRR